MSLVRRGPKRYVVAEVTMEPYHFSEKGHSSFEAAQDEINEIEDGGNGNWAVFEFQEVEAAK
jgi:hypothetical protein